MLLEEGEKLFSTENNLRNSDFNIQIGTADKDTVQNIKNGLATAENILLKKHFIKKQIGASARCDCF